MANFNANTIWTEIIYKELTLNVGFIGLGNMGQGMADNLLEKGTNLTVYTRTKSKIEAMVKKGASSASSVEEITKTSDIILACLPDVATELR